MTTPNGTIEEILAKLTKTLELLAADRTTTATVSPAPICTDRATSISNALALVGTFNYNPQADATFPQWYARSKDVLEETVQDPLHRAQVLLRTLGSSEYTRLRGQLSPETPESKTYDELVEILTNTFGPTKSLFRRRHDILTIRADPGTSAEDIINLGNLKGDEFELSNLTPNMFKIFIILLIAADPAFKYLRAIILKAVDDRPEITIAELREVVRRHVTRSDDVSIDSNTTALRGEIEASTINQVSRNQRNNRAELKPNTRYGKNRPCRGCNGNHPRSACPFIDAVCHSCNKTGHIAKVCMSEGKNRQTKLNTPTFNALEQTDFKRYRAHVTLNINNVRVRFRIDNGADMSVIGLQIWRQLGCPSLLPLNAPCTGVNGKRLETLGYFTATFNLENLTVTGPVLVLQQTNAALLGGNLPYALGLLSTSSQVELSPVSVQHTYPSLIRQQYAPLFKDELGLCSRLQINLRTKDDAVPKFSPARPVALAIRELVDAEIDRLLQNGTLSTVESSDWAAPVVIARKPNGRIRLCADYSTGLNDALQNVEYPIPNVEDIMAKLSGNRVFT